MRLDDLGLPLAAARAAKYALLRCSARVQASRPPPENTLRACFIIGSGRSGTTALGRAFEGHPEIRYLYEPYHLWERIDTRADVTGFHSPPRDKLFFMDESHATAGARDRFATLIARPVGGRRTRVLEKTPHNACRIGWIESLAREPRYLHVIRDGTHVARSIQRLATRPTYRLLGRSGYNQWWGEGDLKWTTLARQGAARGYFPESTHDLRDDAERGAYEWLVSVLEVRRAAEALGPRLLEIRFDDLVAEPQRHLERAATHFGLSREDEWLAAAARTIESQQRARPDPLSLPRPMADAFNELQEQFRFSSRAVSR